MFAATAEKAKEMSDLLDEDYDIFVIFPNYYCDALGNEVGMESETFNEEDLHRRFLDLLYQQARLKVIPAYNRH